MDIANPSGPEVLSEGFAPARERYFNRELSWLAFNERVLAEAQNAEYPLLERLRFLSISGSNLDEFMMIRVAGLAGQVNRGIEARSIDGKTPSQQLAEIRRRVRALELAQQNTLADLRRQLAKRGIDIADGQSLRPSVLRHLRRYFIEQISPVITPQAIDPAHPFPFVANLGMGVLFNLTRRADEAALVEMVLVPSAIPRFVRTPGDEATFVPVEDVIRRFAHLLFPGFRIEGSGVFRVLRDSDMEVEEEAEDLVRYFRSAIQRRRRGRVILLELAGDFDPEAEQLLRQHLGLKGAFIAKTGGLLGISGLSAIVDEDRPDLKFEPFSPRYPERVLEHDDDCFAAIREKDIVIHHPYESFEVVVDFLRQAAADPAVVSIKQTLYRAGNQSPVIAAVIYCFVDWKTHAKVSMVVRQEDDGFRTYCHFGTGNYHPVTTKVYTDLSFFTADPKLGRDAARLFNFVTGYVQPAKTELLSISPIDLRETLYDLIDRETENARKGRPAAIWAKLNSLTEQGIIDRLYDASEAGVQIELMIRGNCCLRPGVPGLSENIRVKSTIGRFLEHSRIWAFANGYALPSARARVFISSADAMSRNLDRRVEALVPIRNRTVHDQILEQVLLANLLDTEQSWSLAADGTYARMKKRGEAGFNCHTYFMDNPSLSGRGAALAGWSVPKLTLRKGAL